MMTDVRHVSELKDSFIWMSKTPMAAISW